MKATEQYFPVVLFIVLYKVVLTFESVDEILICDHSNESYWAVLLCDTVNYAVQGSSNFWVCGWNPKVWPFKWKLLSSTFMWYCSLCCTKWLCLNEVRKYDHSKESYCRAFHVLLFITLLTVPTFESVDEILKCDRLNESYRAVLSLMLFIMLYKVVLTFESADEILKCDHSNESYWTELSYGAVYYVITISVKLFKSAFL